MDNLIFISHCMDATKNLWGCGHPRGNNKKKKKSSITNHTSNNNGDHGDHHHHHDDDVNFATALIKFMKNRWSSFTAKKTKRKRPSSHSQEKKHSQKPKNGTAPAAAAKKSKRKRPSSHSQEKKHSRKPKTGTAQAAAAKKKHPAGADLVTLQDWMSVELNAAGANSGEFHVFNKQVVVAAAYKKIHPSFDRSSSHNVDDTSYSRKNSRRDQQIMEKLINVDGRAEEVVEAEAASLPPRQSSGGDTAKKKVSFRLPLVTNIFIVGSSPDLKE